MSKRPAIGFIFATVLIDITGLGIIIPVMPTLIQNLIGGTVSEAAQMGGILYSSYAIMQFFCAPIIGGLSDKFGRRPVLLASLFGFGIDYLFLAFAPTIGWLFVGRIIAGMMGASISTANAYIADISTSENRAQNFGLMGAAFGLGFIIGPMLGGFLGSYGERIPFVAAAILALLNWLYGFFILPESLKHENRREFTWKRANPLGTMKSLFRYPIVRGLFIALAFIYIASNAVEANWAYYTKEKFQWGVKETGYSLAVIGILLTIVMGGLIRLIIPKLGQQRSVYFGLGLYTMGFILYAFATEGWMMYVFSAVYCLGAVAGPALQGIMSGILPPNEQGELQGGFTSLRSATSIVGPLLMSSIFSFFTKSPESLYFPGAAMLLGAVLTLCSAMLARMTLKRSLSLVNERAD